MPSLPTRTAAGAPSPGGSASWTSLMHAAYNGMDACVELLLEARALVDAADASGWSSLMACCYKGHQR